MLNLSTLLDDSAIRYADKPAFSFMDTTLTYSQVNQAANQVANGLTKKGIKKGDKVALSCLNLPYFPIIYYGILKAGASVVPLSVLLKPDEIEYHLSDSNAKAYFCFEGTAELPMGKFGHEGFSKVDSCEQFYEIKADPKGNASFEGVETLSDLMKGMLATYDTCDTSAEDTAVIIYTSGTTGKPKGAELTHSNLTISVAVCKGFVNTSEKDTQLIVLPLFHIFAMTVLMNTGIYTGAHNILLPRFDVPSVSLMLIKHKVTIFAGVPTMYWALINNITDKEEIAKMAENLRIAISGGASLPLAVLNDFEDKFKIPILEGYGMSEGSPVVTFNQLEIGTKPGSVGTPVWGVKVKLVDKSGEEVGIGERGELLYKGPNVMKGYYNRPEENKKTLKGGWLHSGDIATKDEDGFYYIVDRTKDMIIRGGLNVYPREIEEVMINHEAVSLVAVIGVPDEGKGEEVKAFVVLKEGKSVDSNELMKWTKSKVADYKYPRIIEFLEALPMSATGKILKKELRK